jgi:hypothetical protein
MPPRGGCSCAKFPLPGFSRRLSFCIIYEKLLDMPKLRISATLALAFALMGTAAFAQNVSERFHQSIRNDDLATLRVLVKDNGANVKDARGQTPHACRSVWQPGGHEAANLQRRGRESCE